MKIGVLADTHDLLRAEVTEALRGCGCILHAGDVSSPGILARLRELAPVHAVRGNNDRDWPEPLPCTLDITLDGLRIGMAHKKKDLPKDTGAYDLLICGHTHQYASAWLEGGERRTLLLNPGSCGPRRFRQPITLAILRTEAGGFTAERIEIPHAPAEALPVPEGDLRSRIELVVRETQKGQTVAAIAQKYGMAPALVEQIARLYLTHPGVTPDGIMTKMGL